MIIDIIINKNPDGLCINEKVEKTMTQNGDFYILCPTVDKGIEETA